MPDPEAILPVPPYAAFEHRDFRLYQVARFLATIGMQMQSVAVGWQLYAVTGRKLDLGLAGLAQFLPMFLLSLPAGHVADRVDRKRHIARCYLGIALCNVVLFVLAHEHVPQIGAIYAVLVVLGAVRAFTGPASQAFLPSLVPPHHVGNAVAWSSSVWQGATIFGPAAGGIVYALTAWLRGVDDGWSADAVYACSAVVITISAVLVAALHAKPPKRDSGGPAIERLLAGIRFVRSRPVILGAMSLDLFAVFLGGAVALLPAYAKDVLHVGAWGLGILRSSPALGASIIAFWLAHHPVSRKAGRVMLASVATFGAATIVFGLSRNFFLSMAALTVVGASDMISVVIRQTLVQLNTPDEMRGRVSAVNLVFVNASNELGEFESGVTGQWFNTIPAILAGGIGTLIVVGVWTLLFPALRDADRLDDGSTGDSP